MAVPYKIGDKTTDFRLEILNLDQERETKVDAVSNQEFSEVILHPALISYSIYAKFMLLDSQ